MEVQFIDHERVPCYGGHTINAVYRVNHKNNYYVIGCRVSGWETGDIELRVTDAALPANTNEDTLVEDAIMELVQDYFQGVTYD